MLLNLSFLSEERFLPLHVYVQFEKKLQTVKKLSLLKIGFNLIFFILI